MRKISEITNGLAGIGGALLDSPPEEAFEGNESGVVRYRLHDAGASSMLPQGAIEGGTGESDEEGGIDFEPVFEWGPNAEEKIAALGDACGATIKKAVETNGIDALGWYRSFHIRGLQWGAHVSLAGVAYLVRHAFSDLPVSSETKVRLAFHAILQHELFHFATDCAIAQAELSQQQAWWVPAMRNRIARNAGYLDEEEKLANAWMLKAFRTALPAFRVKGKQRALKDFVLEQPKGYCWALLVSSLTDWDQGLAKLARCYAEDSGVVNDNPRLWEQSAFEWPALYPINPRIDWRHCAIHLVDDSARYGIPSGWLTFFTCIEHLIEDPKFLKRLEKLASPLQRAWVALKNRFTNQFTPGMDFKPWPPRGPNAYSVRINDNFRALLIRDPAKGIWTAMDIGSHKDLGHG